MNYNVIGGNDGKILKIWNKKVPIEEGAIDQLLDALKLPFVKPYIAIMPDCHAGKGSSVGSVIPCENAIIPAAIGVDICCGMSAYRLNLTREDFINHEETIRNEMIRKVPAGRTNNGGKGDRGAWYNIPPNVQDKWNLFLKDGWDNILANIPGLLNNHTNGVNHLGTLGTGNHFLSLSTDEENKIWLIVHSGSRGIGARIGSHFIEVAQELCKKWFINIPNRDLAYLPAGTKEYEDYMKCMKWCDTFATNSRSIMLKNSFEVIEKILCKDIDITEKINCHHNFVTKVCVHGNNLNVIRKGAVSALNGEKVIIPGAMGKKSFIAHGKGNTESFYSCSHGAGRLMSRAAARNNITLEDHKAETLGVFCDKDASIIDESPHAYKNVEDVMESQSDLVEIEHTLQEFINVKGKDDKDK